MVRGSSAVSLVNEPRRLFGCLGHRIVGKLGLDVAVWVRAEVQRRVRARRGLEERADVPSLEAGSNGTGRTCEHERTRVWVGRMCTGHSRWPGTCHAGVNEDGGRIGRAKSAREATRTGNREAVDRASLKHHIKVQADAHAEIRGERVCRCLKAAACIEECDELCGKRLSFAVVLVGARGKVLAVEYEARTVGPNDDGLGGQIMLPRKRLLKVERLRVHPFDCRRE